MYCFKSIEFRFDPELTAEQFEFVKNLTEIGSSIKNQDGLKKVLNDLFSTILRQFNSNCNFVILVNI